MRRTLVTAVAAVLAATTLAAPARADQGWHPVDEPWQDYQEHGLVLPAERYCGGFDLTTTPVFQKIRYRVVSRWDSGGPRETVYDGPLRTENTNQSTGESVTLDLSGRAEVLQREDGSLATYETKGPVGVGFPEGSVGLSPGFYVLRGRHVVEFPQDGPRRLVVDEGAETDVCALVR